MKKIGFIGAGNMGSALAVAAKKSGAEVYVYDKDEEKAAQKQHCTASEPGPSGTLSGGRRQRGSNS